MSNKLQKRVSEELTLPSSKELASLDPAARWELEERLDDAQDILRSFNDDELRRWVKEGKTQTEIAQIVGRSQQRVSQRCAALGIEPKDRRGRTFTTPSKSDEPASNDYEEARYNEWSVSELRKQIKAARPAHTAQSA